MCTSELTGYLNPDGGRLIFGFRGIREGLTEQKVPCGKCPECQKDYYTSWATRGSRELSNWESSVFITLTYSDEHLPKDKSLDKQAIQLFIKRVKRFFRSTKSNPIRQTYSGEYGTSTNRPHYHAILYNCDFPDRKAHRTSDQGHPVFTSEILTSLWGLGFAEFGYATPATIAYVSKYILKKKTRKEKEKPLNIEIDGITYDVAHEFIEHSRNPGIGACLKDSVSIKKGYLSVNGVRKKLPKYYLEHLKKTDPATYEKLADAKFDFMNSLPKETALRKKQKEEAQKKLTDTKRRL